mmetsp:Transcript_4788/g.15571  ORF Transcript_4788/g.15571 Transcript_4788/m.15571 type:complete len:353 (-) Transcript_4788:134-1192(-)
MRRRRRRGGGRHSGVASSLRRLAAAAIGAAHEPGAVGVGEAGGRVVLSVVRAREAVAVVPIDVALRRVERGARGARPVEARVRLVDEGEQADAEGGLAEGGPGWLRLAPRHVRALPVAAVAEVEVDGAARVGAAVVDGTRALVGVHMPREDEVDARLEEERLQVPAHQLRLARVARVGVVPRRVHHHDHPRRSGAVDRRQVAPQPGVLQRAGLCRGVRRERDEVQRPDGARPPQVARRARRPVRHRVARVVRDPRLGRPNLFLEEDSSFTALAIVRDPRPGRPQPRGSHRSSSQAPSRREAASAWRTCPTASRSRRRTRGRPQGGPASRSLAASSAAAPRWLATPPSGRGRR